MSAIKKLSGLLSMFRADDKGVPFANRNLVIDPAHESWISSSPVALTVGAGYNGATMHVSACGTGGAGTYAQTAFAAAPSSRLGLPRPLRYGGALTQTTASTGTLAGRDVPKVGVRIEDYRLLEGASVTLSVYLTADVARAVQQVEVVQNFGTGGSPTAPVVKLVPINWVLGTNFARFSVRVDIPAAPGITEGTTNNSFTQIAIDYPPGATYTIKDACWQIEFCDPSASSDINGNGGNPTAFEHRGTAAEIQRVGRYCESGPLFMQAPYAAAHGMSVQYAVGKRAAPAMSFVGAITYTSGGSLQANVLSVNSVSGNNFNFLPTAQGGYVSAIWLADSRL